MTECAQTTQPVFLLCPLFAFPLSLPTFFLLFFFYIILLLPLSSYIPSAPQSPSILSSECIHGEGVLG